MPLILTGNTLTPPLQALPAGCIRVTISGQNYVAKYKGTDEYVTFGDRNKEITALVQDLAQMAFARLSLPDKTLRITRKGLILRQGDREHLQSYEANGSDVNLEKYRTLYGRVQANFDEANALQDPSKQEGGGAGDGAPSSEPPFRLLTHQAATATIFNILEGQSSASGSTRPVEFSGSMQVPPAGIIHGAADVREKAAASLVVAPLTEPGSELGQEGAPSRVASRSEKPSPIEEAFAATSARQGPRPPRRQRRRRAPSAGAGQMTSQIRDDFATIKRLREGLGQTEFGIRTIQGYKAKHQILGNLDTEQLFYILLRSIAEPHYQLSGSELTKKLQEVNLKEDLFLPRNHEFLQTMIRILTPFQ